MRRTLTRTLAVTTAAVVLAACGQSGGSDAAATVNGTDIPRELVERIVVAQLESPQAPTEEGAREEAEGEIQRNVLSTLIGVEILEQLTEDSGLEVDDAAIDEAYDEQVALYEEGAATSGQDPDFTTFLETIGLDEDEYRDIIVADLARREALAAEFGTEITDEDVQAVYDEQYTEPQIDARHILVETEDEAEDAIARIEGGEDFAEVAAEVSTDGSAADGGNLGPAPAANYVPEFAAAISEGEVGELLGPIGTDFGFHVIEVLEVLDPVPFEEAEPQIRAQLEAQNAQSPELAAALEEAYAAAEVTLGDGFGEWDPALGQVVDPDAVGEGDPAAPGGGEGVDPSQMTEEELQQMLEEQLGEDGTVPPVEGEGPAEGDAPAEDDAPVDGEDVPAEEPAEE